MDLLGISEENEQQTHAETLRRLVHIIVAVAFALCILIFKVVGNDNILNAIYVMASYTYGPLLGLYAFGLFTKRRIDDRFTPYICLAAPLICGLLDHYAPLWWGYSFGYELLMLNGLLTFGALWVNKCRLGLSQ